MTAEASVRDCSEIRNHRQRHGPPLPRLPAFVSRMKLGRKLQPFPSAQPDLGQGGVRCSLKKGPVGPNLNPRLRSEEDPRYCSSTARMPLPVSQSELFESELPGPQGFVYQPAFIALEEEEALLDAIRGLPLQEAQFRQFTARRRTMVYGSAYDFDRNALDPAPPIPQFLMPLREKVASWVGLPATAFLHGLVSEYRPGTPLGWHRDVPDFGVVVGVSLGSAARMRLRPYRPGERNRREDVIAMDLQPRSAYQIRDAARWEWQHSIAPTRALRYSITFRTARRP
jgi:alkylated DNA repair dioxygenase AlkB